MNANEKNFLNYSHYIVSITGTIYFIIKYFFQVNGEWGIESHPFEVHLQHIHILTVPFLLFAVAMIFRDHVLKKIVTKFKLMRKSGIALIALFVLMVFSGYLIQVSMNDLVRKVVINFHLVTSALWVGIFLFHQIKSSELKK